MGLARNPKTWIALASAALLSIVACDAMQPQPATDDDRAQQLIGLMGSDLSAIPELRAVLGIGRETRLRVVVRVRLDPSTTLRGMMRQLGFDAPFVGLGMGVPGTGGVNVQDQHYARASPPSPAAAVSTLARRPRG